MAPRRAKPNPCSHNTSSTLHTYKTSIGLNFRACSCSILSWACLLETAAPLRFPVDAGTPHDMYDTVPLSSNFLATQPATTPSSWATPPRGPPFSSLIHPSIRTLDPLERSELAPTDDETLNCFHTPALQALVPIRCLPPFSILLLAPHLRILNFHDRVYGDSTH
jgi:hypothetical protein